METPTRDQFAAAYLTLPETTREMADAIYDILTGPATVDFLQSVDDVCQRVAATSAAPEEA